MEKLKHLDLLIINTFSAKVLAACLVYTPITNFVAFAKHVF